jgi:DNA-binding transcriptional LysR family regulator
LPALARYHRLYPNVKISIHRVFSRDVPREILNYTLDLGVISFVPQDRKIGAIEFLRDELTFVVYPRHRLAGRHTVNLRELGEEIFVAHIVESPYRTRVIQLFAKHRIPLRMDVDLPTIESIKRFVQMEMGVAIVPRMCVRMEIERGDLIEVKIREMRLPRHLYLVYRRDHTFSPAARALFQLLRPRAAAKRASAKPAPELAALVVESEN